MKRLLMLLAAVPLLIAAAKPADPALPAYLSFPPAVHVKDQRALTTEDYGEAEFRQANSRQVTVQRGKHWSAALILSDAGPKTNGKESWAAIKPALLQGGWSVESEFDENPFTTVLRYRKDGKDVWATLGIFSATDIRLQVIEIAMPDIAFAAPPPSAMPETIADKGDFPYLPPLPGAAFNRSTHDTGPMVFKLPGSNEAQLVGSASYTKEYKEPPGISNLYFVTAYRTALQKAGWAILDESESLHQGDSALIVHYAKNGRDIWANLHRGNGVVTIKVADAGALDLSGQFDRDCHVALYGVLFDFNKATLKPDSNSMLQRVQAMLQKDAAVKVEVQGHTDNVGGDAYNQKLSEARAASVMAWLSAHGTAAARLTAKGYGETMPVASNANDDGRAKNRRVEIAKPGCGSAGQVAQSGPAVSLPKGTVLSCTLAPAQGTDHPFSIKNSTGKPLAKETIINTVVNWKNAAFPAGQQDDCFAIDSDLAANGVVSHSSKITAAGAEARSCQAYVSAAHPVVEHDAGGGRFTTCDPP